MNAKTIDPASLNHLPSRITYLKSFLSFTNTDGLALNASTLLITSTMPTILDTIHTRLFAQDITAKAFAHKFPPDGSSLQLKLFEGWLMRIVTNTDWTPDSPYWKYLDSLGHMHTGDSSPGGGAGSTRPEGWRVEFMHFALLLGVLEDVVVEAVLEKGEGFGLDWEGRMRVVRAWNKVLWVQNDLFARWFVVDLDGGVVQAELETNHAHG